MKIIVLLLFLSIPSILTAQDDFKEVGTLLENNQFSEAESKLEMILKKEPRNERAIMMLGDIESYRKNWDEAINFYKRLLEIDPENAEFNFNYGGALGLKALEVPKIQAVIYISDIKKHLEKAAALDPEIIGPRRALVKLYMQLPMLLGGSQSKAEKYASQLKNVSPVDYFLAKGFIVNLDEGPDEAREWYKKGFESLEELSAQKRRNNLNFDFGKASADLNLYPQKGLELLDLYRQNYGYEDVYEPAFSYLYTARIFVNMGNKKEALKSIDKALTLRDNFSEAEEEKERILDL